MDRRAAALREKLGFKPPNKLLYRARPSLAVAWVTVVEADGIGGAWTSIVEGNFPFDINVLYESHFRSEEEAMRVAEEVVQSRADPEIVLQPEAIRLLSQRRRKRSRVGNSKRRQPAT